jgi:hypothetical protein
MVAPTLSIMGRTDMNRPHPVSTVPDSELRRAANALRKAGKPTEAKRIERNLPATRKK